MTINQAHNYIKLEVDKTSSLELPAFEPEEIDYFLDDSILTFIKTRYSGNNSKQESFEETQKRIDDLRTLVVEVTLTTPATAGSYGANSVEFDLPATYLFSLGEAASITVSGVTSRTPVTPTSQDAVDMDLINPFSMHNLRLGEARPLRLFVDDQIVLIGDGNYTINSVYLSYISLPEKMADVADRDVEYGSLSDQAMAEVVKITANKMLENIGDQRYQSHSIELTNME